MTIKKIEGTYFLVDRCGELLDSFDDRESAELALFDRTRGWESYWDTERRGDNQMTREEIQFIIDNHVSGTDEIGGEMVPWIGVPNMPGRKPFTTEEILEALNVKGNREADDDYSYQAERHESL